MNPQRLSSGARFRWREVTYQILRLLPEGQVQLEETLTGATSQVEMVILVRALFEAELEFSVAARTTTTSEVSNAPTRSVFSLQLSDYPTELVAVARYRLEVIQPLLNLNPRTRASVNARVQEIRAAQSSSEERTLKNSVSVAAVYRWLKDYTQSGQDLRALIPAVQERGGKAASRLRTEANTLVDLVIRDKAKAQEKITLDDIHCELAVRISEENQRRPAADQLSLPSRATVARRMLLADFGQAGLTRRGLRSVKQYGQTPYPELPLERVEIDHTRSDLIVIDDRDNLPLGRLTLTYCLDMATRYPLGYYLGFEPPSYLTVMDCLHHAILPKSDVRALYGTEHGWLAYGIPSTLVIDNGKEFIGHDLEDACCLLGSVLQYSPVLTPQFKAGVERMFGSMNTLLFHTLPGTTFSNPGERGNYNSSQQACVYLSEVDKILHLFLVDIYAERFHTGLNGIPARCWADKTRSGFAPALPPKADELSILLGRTETRALQAYGIKFASLRYNCHDLLTLRTRLKGEAVKIKYHPADLSYLYVYDPFERQYLRVPALDQDYTHELSLWKHRVIRQAVLEEQDQVDPVALGQAKRKIQAIVDEGRQRKGLQTRTRIARWDLAGKPTREAALATPPSEIEANSPPAIANTDLKMLPAAQSTIPISKDTGDEEGWDVSYAPLRKSLPAPVKTSSDQVVQHG